MQQLKQQNETIELLKQSIETNTKMMPKIEIIITTQFL